jgi:hypothetical protein
MLERLKRAAYHACGGNPRFYLTYEVMPRQTVEVFRECREEASPRPSPKSILQRSRGYSGLTTDSKIQLLSPSKCRSHH